MIEAGVLALAMFAAAFSGASFTALFMRRRRTHGVQRTDLIPGGRIGDLGSVWRISGRGIESSPDRPSTMHIDLVEEKS